jgi:predicted NAD/FAD-binding protein
MQSFFAPMDLTRDALVENLPQRSFGKLWRDSMWQPAMRSLWAIHYATCRVPPLRVFLPFWFEPATAS